MVTFEEIGGSDVLDVWGGSGSRVVKESQKSEGRWSAYMKSIVEHQGKFYEVDWERGLTENQEDYYPDEDQELVEVFPKEKVFCYRETEYLTKAELEQASDTGKILQESRVASLDARGLGPALEKELASLKKVSTGNVLEALSAVEVLREVPGFSARAALVKEFFEKFFGE